MKNKILAGAVGGFVFVVVLLVLVLTKSSPQQARGQGAEDSAGGKVVVDVEGEEPAVPKAKATQPKIPPAVTPSKGKGEDLDLSGLVTEEPLAEKEVTFTRSRAVGKNPVTGRVKGIIFTGEDGIAYPFWNQINEGARFQNQALAQVGKVKIGEKYKVRGSEERPYNGTPQFKIKEFIK